MMQQAQWIISIFVITASCSAVSLQDQLRQYDVSIASGSVLAKDSVLQAKYAKALELLAAEMDQEAAEGVANKLHGLVDWTGIKRGGTPKDSKVRLATFKKEVQSVAFQATTKAAILRVIARMEKKAGGLSVGARVGIGAGSVAAILAAIAGVVLHRKHNEGVGNGEAAVVPLEPNVLAPNAPEQQAARIDPAQEGDGGQQDALLLPVAPVKPLEAVLNPDTMISASSTLVAPCLSVAYAESRGDVEVVRGREPDFSETDRFYLQELAPVDIQQKEVGSVCAGVSQIRGGYDDQDAQCLVDAFSYPDDASVYTICAVFDGFDGKSVAQYCAAELVRFLQEKKVDFYSDEAIRRAWVQFDESRILSQDRFKYYGATAAVAVCLPNGGVKVINVGSSRIIGLHERSIVCDSLRPSQLNRSYVRERNNNVFGDATRRTSDLFVNFATGEVTYWQDASKTFEKIRGEVCPVPDIITFSPGQARSLDFLVLACEGLWQVLEPQQVADYVGSAFQGGLLSGYDISRGLTEKAYLEKSKFRRASGHTNISVMVVDLRNGVKTCVDGAPESAYRLDSFVLPTNIKDFDNSFFGWSFLKISKNVMRIPNRDPETYDNTEYTHPEYGVISLKSPLGGAKGSVFLNSKGSAAIASFVGTYDLVSGVIEWNESRLLATKNKKVSLSK